MTSSLLAPEVPLNTLAFYWRSLTEILQGQFRVLFVPPVLSAWLEVAESCMLGDPHTAIAHLTALRKLGVQIAIDDFGAGYSSLAFLKNLPVHPLKLDKAFLEDAAPGSKNQVILASIIELGHHLQLRLVAEGIENIEQSAILKTLHCDYGQGYLFSRPLAVTDMIATFNTFKSVSPSPQIPPRPVPQVLRESETLMVQSPADRT